MKSIKPCATKKQQIFLAALMWSTVGIFLFARGLWNITLLDDPLKILWISLALMVGLLKAKIVLEKTARRIVSRIRARAENSCLFGFLSLKSWLLIIAMVAMGRILRISPLSRSLVWSIYIAIGAALFASSRIIWKQWNGV